MDLGTGVVVAAVLLIAAWQLDKRNAWRGFFKIAASVSVLALIAGATLYGVSRHRANEKVESRRVVMGLKAASAKRQVHQLRTGALHTLGGLSLGQNRAEIEYALGSSFRKSGESLSWEKTDKVVAAVLGSDNRVHYIACNGRYWARASCGYLAGLAMDSTEAQVISTLGDPQKVFFKKAMKILRYGQARNLDIYLAEGKVVMFSVSQQASTEFPSSLRRAKELSDLMDADFMAGLADEASGNIGKACAHFQSAILLSAMRVEHATSLGDPVHLEETVGTRKMMQRYSSENCP